MGLVKEQWDENKARGFIAIAIEAAAEAYVPGSYDARLFHAWDLALAAAFVSEDLAAVRAACLEYLRLATPGGDRNAGP